jgi:UDP-glucose 4-epimerase
MKYLIIGATGTMGKLVVDALRQDPENHILGMSRDEQKIGRMPKYNNVSYTIGDLRDKARVMAVMSQGFDSVINLAALKCVDILEANPMEAVKTNVLGSQNLVEAAEVNGCPKIVFTSTDKAVYPINAYGQSKAMAECIYRQYRGPCSVFRYGNILGSRGSVLHTFVDQILKKKPLTITGLYMTRFWITSDQVCKTLVKDASDLQLVNALKIIFSKTYRIYDVALAVSEIMGRKYDPRNYEIVGFRPGEKLHETLVKNSDDYIAVNADHDAEKDFTSQDYDRYEQHEFIDLIDPIVAEILGEK